MKHYLNRCTPFYAQCMLPLSISYVSYAYVCLYSMFLIFHNACSAHKYLFVTIQSTQKFVLDGTLPQHICNIICDVNRVLLQYKIYNTNNVDFYIYQGQFSTNAEKCRTKLSNCQCDNFMPIYPKNFCRTVKYWPVQKFTLPATNRTLSYIKL